MNYRPLGKTGIRVSEIGFGTWGIGGAEKGAIAYGPTQDQVSQKALHFAFESGINFFDTSDFYGYGHSEKLLGNAFKGLRDQVFFASKGGFLAYPDKQDFSIAYLQNGIEQSLIRLQTDYLDLYQLHSPALHVLNSRELLEFLVNLKASGKVRSLGISLRSPDDGLLAIEEFDFDVIQVNLNLIDQRALDNGLLSACAKRDIGTIIRTPLCFGFLTGEYSGEQAFDQFDHRSLWSKDQIELWATAYRKFVSVLSEEYDLTAAQLALRFCLSVSGVSTVIPGMLTNNQVKENIGASGRPLLSQESLEKVREVYAGHTFFVKKEN